MLDGKNERFENVDVSKISVVRFTDQILTLVLSDPKPYGENHMNVIILDQCIQS